MIGGPSIAAPYDKEFLTQFLDYCVANSCEVNFLSWHELSDGDSTIPAIPQHVADARSSFQNNPVYASLHLQRIDLNEVVGPIATRNPGGILAYLASVEASGADGAAKACWADSLGNPECSPNSLDGLVTLDGKPRSGWWVYKTYADGVASRILSTSTDLRIACLASSTSEATSLPQLVIGYVNFQGTNTGQPTEALIRVDLSGLKNISALTVLSYSLRSLDIKMLF